MTLTVLLLQMGLFTRNAYCLLSDPEVDVIPSEVGIGELVAVNAKISVISC